MPSLATLTPIPKSRDVGPDDLNILYHLLSGRYSNTRGAVIETTTRGLGLAVKLWGYDGRMASGLINTTDYALDVRNRETTAQRSFAARRADNKVVFEVRGGLPYGVVNTTSGVSPTQVMVFDQPAGGVLGGTYPNPSFALATEYHRVYPTMIVAWYGSATTTLIGGNNELVDAPGWVLCNGASVTLRSGSVVVTPNMTDRYPIGAGGTVAKGGTTGNSMAGQAAISIAHTHPQTDHTHGLADHSHGLNGHTHTITHTHDLGGHDHDISHDHTLPSHAHSIGAHTHTYSHTHGISHSHSLTDHTHGPGTLSLPHKHLHSHGGTTGAASGSSTRLDGANAVASTAHVHPFTTDSDDSSISSSQTASGVTSGASALSTAGQSPTISDVPSPSSVTSAPSPDNTGNPTTSPSISHIGITPGTPSPDSTGAAVPGSSGGASGSTAGSGALSTTTTSAVSTGAATTATINATPPTLGWWWLMKL